MRDRRRLNRGRWGRQPMGRGLVGKFSLTISKYQCSGSGSYRLRNFRRIRIRNEFEIKQLWKTDSTLSNIFHFKTLTVSNRGLQNYLQDLGPLSQIHNIECKKDVHLVLNLDRLGAPCLSICRVTGPAPTFKLTGFGSGFLSF
jgi:hypothetical protein